MTLTEQIVTIGLCALGTMAARFLPFLVFSEKRPTPAFVRYIGRHLPSAVFGMYHKRNIEYFRFKLSIFAVWSQYMKNILRCGKILARRMDIKAVPVMIVTVCLISVNGKKRKQRDELQTLTQYVFYRSIISSVIIRIKGQHASGKSIHHIFARSFHDYIPDKRSRKFTIVCQKP